MGTFSTRRRFDTICALLAVAIAVVGTSGVFVVREAGRATEVAFEDVIADFRAAPAPPTVPAAAAAVDPPVAPAAVAATAAPSGDPGPSEVSTPGSAPPTTSAATPPTIATTAPKATGPTKPAEGVYRYTVTGGESISIAGGNRRYPDEVFAIVRHTPCGHSIEVQVLEEHVDRTELCTTEDGLFLVREAKTISFFGQSDTGDIACDPPMPLIADRAVPGTSATWHCRAGTNTTTGTVTRGHDVEVPVGGSPVRGSAVEWRWQATGQSSGNGTTRWVFDGTGLPLRIERANATTSQTALGRVRYEEDATFVLADAAPRR